MGAVICATDRASDVAALAVETAAGWSVLLAHDLTAPQLVSISAGEPFGDVTATVLGDAPEPVALDRSSSHVTLKVAPSRLVRVDLARASKP